MEVLRESSAFEFSHSLDHSRPGQAGSKLPKFRALQDICITTALSCPPFSTAGRSWLYRLNLSRAPSLVEPGFKRTVEPQEGIPALPRDRLHPVCFLARGSL